MPKFDTYQSVTDAVIEALETGTKPWQREWQGAPFQMPHRANGTPYRGINVLLLWISADQFGHTGKHWMTFKQAKSLGGCVRKGQKGTRIVFFKQLEVDDRHGDDGDTVKIPFARSYTVFNSAQIDGLPDEFAPADYVPAQGIERDAWAEKALRSCGATIEERGAAAYYSPAADVVTMPEFERFASSSGYLATLAHELCHWTGHKTRLDRFGKNTRTSYAMEELVAELGAAFVGSRLGIVGEHIDNHAAYLKGWLEALKGDKRAIFRAASLAQAAADMVLANAEPIAADLLETRAIEAESTPEPEPAAATGRLAYCTNSQPGTFNHECGKPSVWIGTHATGHQQAFCEDCKRNGYEARTVKAWQKVSQPSASPAPATAPQQVELAL